MSRYLFVLTIFIFVLGSFTTSSLAQLGDDTPNLTTVFAILPESPGGNCANGGSLIASGLDLNGNGNLNFNEVQQVGYACNGNVGPPGPPGPAGPVGAQGPAGPSGPAGPVGAMGPMGSQGPAGPMGAVGPAGAQGPQGDQGPQGEIGPAGPQGEQGIAGTDGEDGAQGPRGDDVLIRFVSSFPSLIQCNNGPGSLFNIFIDMNDNDVFDLGVDEGLEEYAVCDGVAGNDGADGAIGPVGPAGPAGAIGPMGPQGVAGNDGADGSTGPEGPQGPQGTAGTTGAQGAAGLPGINCWDLDADRVNDPNEDINGDGQFNGADCSAAIPTRQVRLVRAEDTTTTSPMGLGGLSSLEVACPPASEAISGGCDIDSNQWEVHLMASEFVSSVSTIPGTTNSGWRCEVRNGDNGGVNGAIATIRATVTCCGSGASVGENCSASAIPSP